MALAYMEEYTLIVNRSVTIVLSMSARMAWQKAGSKVRNHSQRLLEIDLMLEECGNKVISAVGCYGITGGSAK